MGAKKQWTGKEKLAIVLQGLKGDCSVMPPVTEYTSTGELTVSASMPVEVASYLSSDRTTIDIGEQSSDTVSRQFKRSFYRGYYANASTDKIALSSGIITLTYTGCNYEVKDAQGSLSRKSSKNSGVATLKLEVYDNEQQAWIVENEEIRDDFDNSVFENWKQEWSDWVPEGMDTPFPTPASGITYECSDIRYSDDYDRSDQYTIKS